MTQNTDDNHRAVADLRLTEFMERMRCSISDRANEVLGFLYPHQPPEVLVGVLSLHDSPQFHPAHIVHARDGWIAASYIYSAPDLVRERVGNYIDGPAGQHDVTSAIINRAIVEVLEELINNHPGKPVNKTYFISYPVLLGKYSVFAILGLAGEALASYKCGDELIEIHPGFRSFAPASFPSALIRSFLGHAEVMLTSTDEIVAPPCAKMRSRGSVDKKSRAELGDETRRRDCKLRIGQLPTA